MIAVSQEIETRAREIYEASRKKSQVVHPGKN